MKRGFTLIEIMVAITILGAALFVLMDAHYGALQLHVDAQEVAMLHELMQRAVTYAEMEVLVGNYEDSEDFGDYYAGYSYSFEAKPAGGEENAGGLYEVEVTVNGPLDSRTITMYVFSVPLEEREEGLSE